MKNIYLTIASLLILVSQSAVSQVPGTLDTTFNSTGIFTYDFGFHDNIQDVKIQPADQKIVVVGTALTPAYSGKLLVARMLPSGAFDLNFNGSGSLIITSFNESYAYESIIKDDGKILIAGSAADPGFQFSMLVIRLNEDGTIDSTFGTNGIANHEISTGDDFAYAMAEQPDHKIILAGTAIDANFYNAPVVVRLNEDGSIDSTFGTNGGAYIAPIFIDNELTSVLIQPDGKIVVSGHLDNGLTGGGQFSFDILLARFNTDGTADSTFGVNGVVTTSLGGLVDDAFGLALTANGNILVSGFTTLPNFAFDALLLQYDSTGTLDANFGTGGIVQYNYGDMDVAYDVEVQSDGAILIAGIAGQFPPDDNNFLLARYTSAGVPDVTFGTNGVSITPISPNYDEAEAMALQADGKIVLAGKSRVTTQNDIAVARFTNDLSSSVPELTSSSTFIVAPNPANSKQQISFIFESANNSRVTIELYNLHGSLVADIDAGTAFNGTNRIAFQLPDAVVTGMYFVKINGNSGLIATSKLLVIE